jgi:hypothetical protein
MKTRHTIIGWALIDEETGELVCEFAGVSVYKTKKSTELSWIEGPLVRVRQTTEVLTKPKGKKR